MRQPFAHFVGNLSGWPKGTVPTPPILRNLDQYSSELVNGEDGGTYAPEDAIVVGNAMPGAADTDITFNAAGCLLSGVVETVKGNNTGDKDYEPGLILEPGAYPELLVPVTRTIVVPLGFFVESGVQNSSPVYCHDIDPVTLGARTINPGFDLVSGPPVLTVALPFKARHRGATITKVEFRFALAGQRSVVPANKPKFRVARATASAISTMHTNVAPYDASGWYTDTAASVAAYVNANKTRTITYTPNQNNTDIDPATYAYFVQVTTEALTVGGGDLWLSATVFLSSISSLKQE